MGGGLCSFRAGCDERDPMAEAISTRILKFNSILIRR
jgi:hypothetical protein